MINNLVLSNACIWTYMDDTTTAEVVPKGETSGAQLIADKVAEWSQNNRVQLNPDKRKELRVSIARKKEVFESIKIGGKNLEAVSSAKLLGVTISSDLSWNEHINKVIKKSSKRLYFLVLSKMAEVPCEVLKLFYTTCIKSVLDYVPVLYYSLLKYLTHELERIQKRTLAIMCPGLHYNEALTGMD